jgi:hypothetical protein
MERRNISVFQTEDHDVLQSFVEVAAAATHKSGVFYATTKAKAT